MERRESAPVVIIAPDTFIWAHDRLVPRCLHTPMVVHDQLHRLTVEGQGTTPQDREADATWQAFVAEQRLRQLMAQ